MGVEEPEHRWEWHAGLDARIPAAVVERTREIVAAQPGIFRIGHPAVGIDY
jgi:hypothetical protein